MQELSYIQKAEQDKVSVTVSELLYYAFFGSLLFAKGIGLYDGQLSFKVILLLASGCLALKLLLDRYTLSEYIKIGCVIGITGLTYIVSGEKGLLLYGMMMVGMKNVRIKRVFALGTCIWTVTFLATTVLSLFRMDQTVYKVHAKLGLGHIFRWSLGYPHPNVLHVSYLLLAMLVIYVLGDKFKLKHAVWLFLGNCLVFLYSVSYTGFAVFMCLLVGRLYLMWRKKLCLIEKLAIQLIFPTCVGVSLILPITLTGEWFAVLNRLLSTRMELAWRYMKPEYISLFGKKLSEITTENVTMDCAYLSAFITYGIIPFCCICICTLYAICYYLKKDKYLETLLFVAITIGGLTEPFLYNTSFKNISFVFMGGLLFETNSVEEYGILPSTITQKWNTMVELPVVMLDRIKEIMMHICSFRWNKACIAAICACLCAMIVGGTVEYPKGYVVYRKDCADLTKEKHYYLESDMAYQGFRRMKDFSEGEEIEFFSGNIVKMEKVRDVVVTWSISYALVYSITGLYLELRKGTKC